MPFRPFRTGVENPVLQKLVVGVLMAMPILMFGSVVYRLHRNLPIHDDYIIELELANLLSAPTWKEKFHVVFSQLNEHRLAYTRLWFWLVHSFFGQISYSALIAAGNLPVLGIWLLTLWMLRRLATPWLAVVPLSWIIFQLQYYENSLWAMASLQNITVHFLYLLVFVLLSLTRWWSLPAAGLVAGWLCFTSGNGFLALALGCMSLVYQKNWKALVGWFVLSLGLALAYFTGYSHPAQFTLAHNQITLLEKAEGVLIFLGQYLNFHPWATTRSAYLLNGMLLTGLSLGLTVMSIRELVLRFLRKNPMRRHHAVLLITVQCTFFIVLSAIAVVRNRIDLNGWQGLLISRYQLYSTMLALTCYVQTVTLLLLKRRPLGWFSGIALLTSIVTCGLIYQWNISSAYRFRHQALAFYSNWNQMAHPEKAKMMSVFTPVGSEKAEIGRLDALLSQRPAPLAASDTLVSKLVHEPHRHVISSESVTHTNSPDDYTFVLLWSPERRFLFPVTCHGNFGIRSFWLHRVLFRPGFTAETYSFFFHEADRVYRLGLVLNREGQLNVLPTPHEVRSIR